MIYWLCDSLMSLRVVAPCMSWPHLRSSMLLLSPKPLPLSSAQQYDYMYNYKFQQNLYRLGEGIFT